MFLTEWFVVLTGETVNGLRGKSVIGITRPDVGRGKIVLTIFIFECAITQLSILTTVV